VLCLVDLVVVVLRLLLLCCGVLCAMSMWQQSPYDVVVSNSLMNDRSNPALPAKLSVCTAQWSGAGPAVLFASDMPVG
jgi:hypothetical protein